MSNTSRSVAPRFEGVGEPKDWGWRDEKTIEELQVRIAKMIEVLRTVEPDRVDDKRDAEVKMDENGYKLSLTGKSYLLSYALPDFFLS